MAKVEKKVVESYTVVLELSADEAEALLSVLGRVGGSPSLTPRGYIDTIYRALHEVGVGPEYNSYLVGNNDSLADCLHFLNRPVKG